MRPPVDFHLVALQPITPFAQRMWSTNAARRHTRARPFRSSSSPRHASPRTPERARLRHPCSPQNAVFDASLIDASPRCCSRSSRRNSSQIFRMFASIILADRNTSSSGRTCSSTAHVDGNIPIRVRLTPAPRFNVQLTNTDCRAFSQDRLNPTADPPMPRRNPIWNDNALSKERARTGRLPHDRRRAR